MQPADVIARAKEWIAANGGDDTEDRLDIEQMLSELVALVEVRRCEHCQHWRPPCKSVSSDPHGECLLCEEFSPELGPSETRMAFAQESYEQTAVLLCLPEFGCVRFQQKES